MTRTLPLSRALLSTRATTFNRHLLSSVPGVDSDRATGLADLARTLTVAGGGEVDHDAVARRGERAVRRAEPAGHHGRLAGLLVDAHQDAPVRQAVPVVVREILGLGWIEADLVLNDRPGHGRVAVEAPVRGEPERLSGVQDCGRPLKGLAVLSGDSLQRAAVALEDLG